MATSIAQTLFFILVQCYEVVLYIPLKFWNYDLTLEFIDQPFRELPVAKAYIQC